MNFSVNESLVNDSTTTFASTYQDCTPKNNPQRLYSDAFKWTVIITYSFILVIGIMGNALTCMVVFIHKSMRRSIHCYMLNLAIADIIILLLFVPSQSVLVYNHLEWSMGKSACSFFTFVIPAFLSGSIATLMAISIDRYSGVRDPFTWRVKSRRNSKIIIPIIWLFSISSSVPYYIYGGLQRSKLDGCKCIWPTSRFKISYITTMMAIQFIIPFLLIACVYMHIVWILSRGRESINRLHKRMVKMVIFLLFTYLVCVGTQYFEFYYQMVLINSPDSAESGPYIYVISNLLLTIQAAVNPLIYSSTRDDFHLAFKTFIVNCHYRITNLLLDDRYLDEIDYRSETDTERWFNINTGRRGSSGSTVRKKSVESMGGGRISNFEIPPIHVRKASEITIIHVRKASEISLRKASVHSMRRKSSTRAPPLQFIIDSDSIGSCSDYEEGEEPTLRSYRLGTLEFLELEEFHQKMKSNVYKESAVRKLSNAVRKMSRNLSHTLFHGELDECESRRTTLSIDDISSLQERDENSPALDNSNKTLCSLEPVQSEDNLDNSNNSSFDGIVMKIDENKIDHPCRKNGMNYDTNHSTNPVSIKVSMENLQQNGHITNRERRRSRKFGITDFNVKMISEIEDNNVHQPHPREHPNARDKCLSPKRKYSVGLLFRAPVHRKISRSLEDISAATNDNFKRRPSHIVALPGKSALKLSGPPDRRRRPSKSIRWEDTELTDAVQRVVNDIIESIESLEQDNDRMSFCDTASIKIKPIIQSSDCSTENDAFSNFGTAVKMLKGQSDQETNRKDTSMEFLCGLD